jgi:hypothetical protein
MNKTYIPIFSVLAGSAIGFYIGIVGNVSKQGLILIVLNGASLGFILGIVVFSKKYGALLWSLAILLTALFLDWIAGSTIYMGNKLAFATAGLIIGWNFQLFWKQAVFGGLIIGVIGFIWGLNYGRGFGYVQLEPGTLNAFLFAIQCNIAGMVLGRLYVDLSK